MEFGATKRPAGLRVGRSFGGTLAAAVIGLFSSPSPPTAGVDSYYGGNATLQQQQQRAMSMVFQPPSQHAQAQLQCWNGLPDVLPRWHMGGAGAAAMWASSAGSSAARVSCSTLMKAAAAASHHAGVYLGNATAGTAAGGGDGGPALAFNYALQQQQTGGGARMLQEPPPEEGDNYFWVFVMFCCITGVGTIVTGLLAWDAMVRKCCKGRSGVYAPISSTASEV